MKVIQSGRKIQAHMFTVESESCQPFHQNKIITVFSLVSSIPDVCVWFHINLSCKLRLSSWQFHSSSPGLKWYCCYKIQVKNHPDSPKQNFPASIRKEFKKREPLVPEVLKVLIPINHKRSVYKVTLTKAIDREAFIRFLQSHAVLTFISPRLREPTDAVFPFTVMKLCSQGPHFALFSLELSLGWYSSYPVPVQGAHRLWE